MRLIHRKANDPHSLNVPVSGRLGMKLILRTAHIGPIVVRYAKPFPEPTNSIGCQQDT